MKKAILFFLISTMAFMSNIIAQTKVSKEEKIKEQIIALEKSGWEAWKNKDANWFQANTTKEFLSVNSQGISDKEQVVKSVITDCNLKSISLDSFKFVLLNESTVLLTYTTMQNGECGGIKLTIVRASVNYVKQNGKWLEAFYMETPVAE